MPDLIPDDEIERLSRKLRSLSYDEFRLSLEQPDEIPDRFYDSIEIAWQVSFPIWRESGRVQDLPHGIHVPKYFASFAKRLGTHFAEVYRDDFSYPIDLLRRSPLIKVPTPLISTSLNQQTNRELSEVVGVACRRHNSFIWVHYFSEIA